MPKKNFSSGFVSILTLAILAILTSSIITGVIFIQQRQIFREKAYEVANTLVTKTKTLPQTIKKDLDFIFETKLEICNPTKNDIVVSSLEAKKYKTTTYDMLYAVIAKNNRCHLITADENFIKKTSFKFVKHLSEV